MYRFIVNPSAMSWHGKEEWEKIAAKLDKAGLVYEVFFTHEIGHGTTLCRELCAMEDTEVIGVFGGDGTLNEAAAGYDCKKQIPLFYVPCGSGNDFARGLKLRVNRENAAGYLLDLHGLVAKPVDIGMMQAKEKAPHCFLVSSGIGYDAAVCHDLTWHSLKKKLNDLHIGRIGYALLGLKNVLFCPLTDGRLIINDGEKVMNIKKIAFVSAHILPYEGGGFCFAPKAKSDDGCIDLCIMTAPFHLWFLFCLAASVFGGKHIRLPGVHYLQCRCAELELRKSMYIHTDGEDHGSYNTVRFSTNENHITIFQ